MHAIVLRRDLANVPAFMVLVSREYAESVHDALLDAGNEFDIGQVGLEALKELGL